MIFPASFWQFRKIMGKIRQNHRIDNRKDRFAIKSFGHSFRYIGKMSEYQFGKIQNHSRKIIFVCWKDSYQFRKIRIFYRKDKFYYRIDRIFSRIDKFILRKYTEMINCKIELMQKNQYYSKRTTSHS